MRMCFCYVCRTLTKIDDFKDRDGKPGTNPDHDVVLQDWIDRHMHGLALDDHPGGRVFPFDDEQSHLSRAGVGHRLPEDPRFTNVPADSIERHAIEQVREELAKNHIDMADYRDELKDDATKCHRSHGQPSYPGKPCIDYQAANKRLGSKRMPSTWQKWLCTYCPYETTVVTVKRWNRGDYRER